MSKTEKLDLDNICRTKIVATLGPSSTDKIEELIYAGASMFRINTSHGTEEEHIETIQKVRKISKKVNIYIPILLDLQGPKIRVGAITNPVPIKKGDTVVLKHTTKEEKGILPVDYKGISNDVKPNDIILLDDGNIKLQAFKIENKCVYTKVIHGSLIKARKGINLPGATTSLDIITPRDKKFIELAVEQDVDYLALSFVRTASDILKAKKCLKDLGDEYMPVIAKIEKPQAVEEIENIIKVVDGVMVARGDLGIEMSLQDVPIVQKRIIDIANKNKKVCIVATQMLDSMIENPIPTRAEATDIANAIIDGTDAVMLSGETTTGKYPVEAVKMMYSIANTTEKSSFIKTDIDTEILDSYEITSQAIAHGAIKMAEDMNAKAIVAFTHSGYTPRLLSKLKPSVPIFAMSNMPKTCRRLNLYWGMYTQLTDNDTVLDRNMLMTIDKLLKTHTNFKNNDIIVLIGSIPKLITGRTNFIRVHRIGGQK